VVDAISNLFVVSSYAIFFTIFLVSYKNLIQDIEQASSTSLPLVYAIGYIAFRIPGDFLVYVPTMYLNYPTPLGVLIYFLLGLVLAALATGSIFNLNSCADGKNDSHYHHHYGTNSRLQQLQSIN